MNLVNKTVPADSRMPDEGEEPGDARQHGPYYAEGEELLLLVDHGWLITYYRHRWSDVIAREVARPLEHVHREADISSDTHHQWVGLVTSSHNHPVLEVELSYLLHNIWFLVEQGEELGLF